MTPTASKVLAHIPHRPEFRLSQSDIGRRVICLRRHYGLSETQTRLVAELFFGGTRNG